MCLSSHTRASRLWSTRSAHGLVWVSNLPWLRLSAVVGSRPCPVYLLGRSQFSPCSRALQMSLYFSWAGLEPIISGVHGTPWKGCVCSTVARHPVTWRRGRLLLQFSARRWGYGARSTTRPRRPPCSPAPPGDPHPLVSTRPRCPAPGAALPPPDPTAWWLAPPDGPPHSLATARAPGDPAVWWLPPGGPPPSALVPPAPCAPGDMATWWLASPPRAPAHPSGPLVLQIRRQGGTFLTQMNGALLFILFSTFILCSQFWKCRTVLRFYPVLKVMLWQGYVWSGFYKLMCNLLMEISV
jgi:hypothetical protein